jgi:RsiW-degrading membrane proteinase PrsW (M82 family)
MPFYLLDAEGRSVGPYTRGDLELFVVRGLLKMDATVTEEPSGPAKTVRQVLGEPPMLEPPSAGLRGPGRAAGSAEALGVPPPSAGGDFLRLARHLMLPIEDILRLRWLDNRRILALAVVGLLPLVVLVYLQNTGDLGGAYWGVALYSSLLWALFFYVAFSQPTVRVFHCLLAYLGSAVFSISLVALARVLIPLEWVGVWITAPGILTRWVGHLVGVAWIEELAKMFVLYFLWVRRPHPRVMMFYGLMAGLGFGIYEGVAYQSSENLRVSFPGRSTAQGAGIYYMLNILRLTSLPFLHAMWTGIAAYFIGFAAQYPSRRGGLFLAALIVPSLLHATYNTFSSSLIGLTVAMVTVLALNVYLAKGRDFEQVLARGGRP